MFREHPAHVIGRKSKSSLKSYEGAEVPKAQIEIQKDSSNIREKHSTTAGKEESVQKVTEKSTRMESSEVANDERRHTQEEEGTRAAKVPRTESVSVGTITEIPIAVDDGKASSSETSYNKQAIDKPMDEAESPPVKPRNFFSAKLLELGTLETKEEERVR